MILIGIALIALFSIIYLFRSRKFARVKQNLQEKFSQDLVNEQENERSRLAMELHDSVGQKLMLLTKKTKMIQDEDMEVLANGTLEELRSISRGLYPAVLNRFGFSKAVTTMCDEMDSNTELFFTVDVEHVDAYVSKDKAIHLYRIIQECLNNILKHAKAKAVSITIEKQKDEIITTVEDNGVGFDITSGIDKMTSLGMKTLNMRAKLINSQLNFDSKLNQGTTVNIITPIIAHE